MKTQKQELLSICIMGVDDLHGIEDCIRYANKLTDRVFFIDTGQDGAVRSKIPKRGVCVIGIDAMPSSIQTEWVIFLKPNEKITVVSKKKLFSLLRGTEQQGYGVYVQDRTVEALLKEHLFIGNLGQYDDIGDRASVTRIEVRLIRKEYAGQCLRALTAKGPIRQFDSAKIAEGLSVETICPKPVSPNLDDSDDPDRHDRDCLKGEIYYGPVPGERLDELSNYYNGYRILHMGYLDGFMENANRGLGTDGMYLPMLEYLNKNGYFEESRELFETWIKNRDAEDNRELSRTGGIIYAYLFMMDKAIAFFEKAAEGPADHSLFVDLAKLYLISGEREKAAWAIERSLEIQSNPLYEHVLACIRSEQWRPVRLSLCMIARDEEETIGKALESMKHVADEIIVVDTGSSDRTKDIVRDYGGKVIEYPWQDDFSAARNAALKEAQGDYLFILDADEYIDIRNQIELAFLKKILPSNCNAAFRVRIAHEEAPSAMSVSYQDRLSNQKSSEHQVRLFPRREGIVFTNTAFETIDPALKQAEIPVTEVENFKITHKKADGAWRNQRKIAAVARSFSDLDDPVRTLDGGLFFLRMGDLDAACPWFEKIGQTNPRLLARVAMLYTQRKLYGEAKRIIESSLACFPKFPDLTCALSDVYFREENYAKVHEILGRLDFTSEDIPPEFLADAHYQYGIALLEAGNPVQGINHTAQALEKNPFNARYQTGGLYALAKIDQWEGFLDTADQIIRNEKITIDFEIKGFLDIGRLILKLIGCFSDSGREDETRICQMILRHLIQTRLEAGGEIDTMAKLIRKTNMNAFV